MVEVSIWVDVQVLFEDLCISFWVCRGSNGGDDEESENNEEFHLDWFD